MYSFVNDNRRLPFNNMGNYSCGDRKNIDKCGVKCYNTDISIVRDERWTE